MIAIGDQVRTMTGKVGTVEAVDVPTCLGYERAVLLRIGPLTMKFHACDRAAILDHIRAYYHPDDLTSIAAEEPPPCSRPS